MSEQEAGLLTVKAFVVLPALFAFGVWFNHYVADQEQTGRGRGYTAIFVAVGTLATLIGAAFLIGWQSMALVLACFAASGSPMIYGSITRYQEERAREEREQAAKALAAIAEGRPTNGKASD